MSMLVTEAAAAEDGVRLGNTNNRMRALARKQPGCWVAACATTFNRRRES
jgi:hypothetical protein